MTLAPEFDTQDLVGSAEVVAVAGFAQPSPLAGGIAGLPASTSAEPSRFAVARRGLTEMEILEVLHQDPDYAKFLEQMTAGTGHKLPDNPKRIPIAIWSRPRLTAVKSGVRL